MPHRAYQKKMAEIQRWHDQAVTALGRHDCPKAFSCIGNAAVLIGGLGVIIAVNEGAAASMRMMDAVSQEHNAIRKKFIKLCLGTDPTPQDKVAIPSGTLHGF